MEANKKHKQPSSGPKAQKRKERDKQKRGITDKSRHNPKAFTATSARNAAKQFMRNQDLLNKKLHVPLVNRGSDDLPPPVIVAVVGPPNVGKTTLVKSIVKGLTRHTLPSVKGPVTVVAGKTRRLTFVECPNDLAGMIDVAKVADLVLLLVDASFGFEMETFEFLNVCQAHGFPKVMGVLTHLDNFRDGKTLQATKKQLKARFWTEIYDGAKVFYLSGLKNGKYPKREVHNLCRFISVAKFRPLIWRNTHPGLLVDRVEDLTDPGLVHANASVDRTVGLYGYVRGTALRKHNKVHVAGVGDFDVSEIAALADPCPLPDKERKRLNDREKLLYAPMGDVGNILFDQDAMYINIEDHQVVFTKREGEGEEGMVLGEGPQMVRSLQELGKHSSHQLGVDEQLGNGEVSLFAGGAPLRVGGASGAGGQSDSNSSEEGSDDDDEEGIDDEDDDEEGDEEEESGSEGGSDSEEGDDDMGAPDAHQGFQHVHEVKVDDGGRVRRRAVFPGADDANELKWKEQLAESASRRHVQRVNLMRLVYGDDDNENQDGLASDDEVPSDEESDDGENFFRLKRDDAVPSGQHGKGDDGEGEGESESDDEEEGEEGDDGDEGRFVMLDEDSCKFFVKRARVRDWTTDEMQALIRNRFVTGNWNSDGQGDGEGKEEEGEGKDDGDDVFGDFEDLETGQKFTAGKGKGGEEGEGDDKGEGEDAGNEDEDEEAAKRRKMKEDLKSKFNAEYDEEAPEEDITMYDDIKQQMDKQKQLNRQEFEDLSPEERLDLEGFLPGTYVRLTLKGVPCEFMTHFDPHFPVLVGGLQPHEDTLQFVQARIKRHRWYGKKLKNNDPLIISLGWRRFQTRPLLCMRDTTGRRRMLKYTPDHMHCMCTFYAPIAPPNTGLCAFQSLKNNQSNFRVAATGVVLEVDDSFQVVKKLKLTGFPFKIFKNSAFIKDMFNSKLEVTKFVGAAIKTVSGIRGQIKKAVKEGPEGTFRATFEDKILLSDIVFLRAWVPVECEKFYLPVASHLMRERSQQWQGMKPVGQLRAELGKTAPVEFDSLYKPIERGPRRFNALRIPKQLAEALPIAAKPKTWSKPGANSYMAKRAVVLEADEKKAKLLVSTLNTLKKVRDSKQRRAQQRRKAEKKQKFREAAVKKREGIKANMKRRYLEEANPGISKKIKLSKV